MSRTYRAPESKNARGDLLRQRRRADRLRRLTRQPIAADSQDGQQ